MTKIQNPKILSTDGHAQVESEVEELQTAVQNTTHNLVKEVGYGIEHPDSRALKHLASMALFILLVINAFIGYQMWEQTKQMTQLNQQVQDMRGNMNK